MTASLPQSTIESAAAIPLGRDRDGATLDRGLAIAARAHGLTFITFPANVVAAAQLVDAWRQTAESLVAWTAPDGLVVVGFGAACELRGTGRARWDEVVAAARRLSIAGAVIGGVGAPVSALEVARPRFIGGAAFAPGAADGAPWTGFGDAWFVMPRWTYVHDGKRAQLVLALDGREAGEVSRWHHELAVHRAALARSFTHRAQPALVTLAPADRETWRAQIEAIVVAIDRAICSKIVAARTCTVALAGDVRAADLLAALDARHADCVRVLVRPPGSGTLVGATPERLVRRRGALVECDALAGTIARPTTVDAAAAAGDSARLALLASGKDQREHELVVSAICSALVDAGGDVSVAATAVRSLRHVLHLHTPIRATLDQRRHVLELVARLHPTPAVGGTPTAVAVDWIASREPVPRGWYGAPVGWFDLDGDGELAVAIRSGVLDGPRAHLWAGAGIVAGSDPDRELAETEVKLQAMLGALGVTG